MSWHGVQCGLKIFEEKRSGRRKTTADEQYLKVLSLRNWKNPAKTWPFSWSIFTEASSEIILVLCSYQEAIFKEGGKGRKDRGMQELDWKSLARGLTEWWMKIFRFWLIINKYHRGQKKDTKISVQQSLNHAVSWFEAAFQTVVLGILSKLMECQSTVRATA